MSSSRSIPTEDRVSSLPDSIISHILSFLPTKDSVATSVLSKRWNPLWLSVLDLNFDAQTFKDYITFRHAIHSVMLSRDIKLPIRSFHLKFGNEYDIIDINRFINAAIQRGIENLNIEMSEKVSGLTCIIFSCKTLTLLKLKNLSVKDDNCQVDLPILKVLCFDNMVFNGKPYFKKILLGCPILEELQIPNAAFYLRKLNPETRNLVRTSIPQNIFAHFFTRVEMMRLKKDKKCVLGVLQRTPILQHLTIHQMESGIIEDNWKDPETVPRCLSSQLKTCLFTGCRGRKCELQFVEYVMQNSKVLRSMTIRSASSITLNEKHEMLRKLSVCPRGCKLIDED